MYSYYYIFKFGSITICIKMWLSLVPLILHLFPQGTPYTLVYSLGLQFVDPTSLCLTPVIILWIFKEYML